MFPRYGFCHSQMAFAFAYLILMHDFFLIKLLTANVLDASCKSESYTNSIVPSKKGWSF